MGCVGAGNGRLPLVFGSLFFSSKEILKEAKQGVASNLKKGKKKESFHFIQSQICLNLFYVFSFKKKCVFLFHCWHSRAPLCCWHSRAPLCSTPYRERRATPLRGVEQFHSTLGGFIRLFSKQILYDCQFFIGFYQISTQKLRAFQHLYHAPIKVRVFHRF